jgi:hypothetical protein
LIGFTLLLHYFEGAFGNVMPLNCAYLYFLYCLPPLFKFELADQIKNCKINYERRLVEILHQSMFENIFNKGL